MVLHRGRRSIRCTVCLLSYSSRRFRSVQSFCQSSCLSFANPDKDVKMLLDAEALAKSAQIDPTILEVSESFPSSVTRTQCRLLTISQFAQKYPQPPVEWKDVESVRASIAAMMAQGEALLGPPEAGLIEEYKSIPMSDGFQSKLKIHRPATKPSGGSPLIFLFFGGGFISGNEEMMTPYARAMVRLFGAVCVNAAYRLAPEHKFPVSQMDAWDSTKWLAEHASEIGADLSKGFVLGGVSAGATCAAVVTTKSIEEPLAHPITGQWLCVPSLMDEALVPEKYKPYFLSREQNKEAPILPSSALDELQTMVHWDDKSSMRYPLNSKAPLSKVPPTYTQACGMDSIRDDALIYDEMLKEAGVKTKIDLYPGCPHGHFAFFPGLEVSNRALADIMVGMGWLLGKEVTAEQGLKAMGGPL